MHTPAGDRDLAEKRIVIVGGPKTGKTTLAEQLMLSTDLEIDHVFHTDDLIGTHTWADVPEAIIEWMRRPGPWVIEGVQTARGLRRWMKTLDPAVPLPVDLVIVKTTPFVELTKGQASMMKGVMTVWKEVEPLLGSVVDVVYW